MYIKPQSDPRLVLDVRGADRREGAKVILYENKGDLADNQLWYEDDRGVIRSKMNAFAMDLSGNLVAYFFHCEAVVHCRHHHYLPTAFMFSYQTNDNHVFISFPLKFPQQASPVRHSAASLILSVMKYPFTSQPCNFDISFVL